MLINFEWEMIDKKSRGYTERARVINGWLIRTYIDNGETESSCVSMSFINDPDHVWKIK